MILCGSKINKPNISRLHAAIKVPTELAENSIHTDEVKKELLLEYPDIDFQEKENDYAVGKLAYDRTQVYLSNLFYWSIVGYIIGLFLVHHYLF